MEKIHCKDNSISFLSLGHVSHACAESKARGFFGLFYTLTQKTTYRSNQLLLNNLLSLLLSTLHARRYITMINSDKERRNKMCT